MYEDDQSSEGGPKSSFEVYRAEGDVLFKQGEYKKALESYNRALELKTSDKNCLVARAQCYLQLGESELALADAEATLDDDKNFIKGIFQKAEALYQKGDFEFALVFYHRGHKLRPEVKGFRLGIQKSQEAIDNSIGDTAGITLENKGDMAYFYKQEEKGKKKKGGSGYQRAMVRKESGKRKDRPRSQFTDTKTCKQLLGELYADKEYLEQLLKDTESSGRNTDTNNEINRLARDGLEYLDTRTEFWQQQKPMYSRKRDKNMRDGTRGRQDMANYIINELEKIENAQSEGKWSQSLKMAKKVQRQMEDASDDDVPNRAEIMASLHSYIGNAHLEMEDFESALEHHTKDQEIADQHDIPDAKSRAMDNLGRVYARMGEFQKAIDIWEEKLPLSKSSLENTWLYHEIGRCHLELGEFKKAQECGEKSLKEAEEADDEVWKLNANALIAQSYVRLKEYQLALDHFESALDIVKVQQDKTAESAIRKAIDDVNQRIVQGEKDDEGEEEEQAATHAEIPVDNEPETKVSENKNSETPKEVKAEVKSEAKESTSVVKEKDTAGEDRDKNQESKDSPKEKPDSPKEKPDSPKEKPDSPKEAVKEDDDKKDDKEASSDEKKDDAKTDEDETKK